MIIISNYVLLIMHNNYCSIYLFNNKLSQVIEKKIN